MSGKLFLKLAARPEELPRVQAALADLAARERWPPRLLQRVELALEEVILNVMTHGRVGGARRLELTLTPDLDAITIELVDDGPPFDPLQDAPRPDLGAALEDRPVGGLGLHLVRTMMDEMGYQYADGKNRLTLVIRRT